MGEWKQKQLSDLVLFQRGHDLPRTVMVEGEIPVAGSNGIIGFHNKATTKGPGITIGRSGNIGTPHFYETDYWAHNTVLFAKELKGDPKFVFYFLRNLDLSQFNAGSAVPTLNRNHIHEIEIHVPDVSEQKAIAEVLSSLDDKIDLLHRQNKTLESLAQTLFRQWFIEEADDSWETVTLGELFDIGIGRTPPRKEQHWFSTNPKDVKWISIKDMGNCGVYIDSTAEYLTAEAVEQFNVPIIPANTLLLSFKMTLGRLAITTETMLSNEAIAHFKHKDGSSLFPEFLYLFLTTYKFELLGSTSSIVEAINSQMIKEMEMVVPDDATLGKFKESIKPTFSKIRENSIQIKTLIRMRDSLLPKLMSGEIQIDNQT
jgi:type I restriction enzyme S subunit